MINSHSFSEEVGYQMYSSQGYLVVQVPCYVFCPVMLRRALDDTQKSLQSLANIVVLLFSPLLAPFFAVFFLFLDFRVPQRREYLYILGVPIGCLVQWSPCASLLSPVTANSFLSVFSSENNEMVSWKSSCMRN